MSKAAKVKLAGILHSAGYNLGAILSAIKYPQCVSLRQYFKATDTPADLSVTVYMGEKSEVTTLSADQTNSELSEPYLPLESYVEAAGSHVMQFNYNKKGTAVMLTFTENLSIPAPLNWPALDFIAPRYPPAKT